MWKPLFIEYEIGMREHKPVEILEDMRKRIYFDWEAEEKDRHLSLSEALMVAIHYDHIEMVEYLLANNAEQATEVSKWSRSHLVYAVDSDKVDVVEKLLQYTMTSKGMSNQFVNDMNYIKSTTGKISDDMARPYADRKGGCRKYGTTKSAIHVACKLGRVRCLELLLQYGADPSVTDHLGFTALGYTIMKLVHGRRVQQIDDPIFDCIERLVRALPTFRLSHYILPRLWQFANEADDKEEADAQEDAANEDDDPLSDLSSEERENLKAKLTGTVREVLTRMSNAGKLQHLCRHSIRKHFVSAHIAPETYNNLPLPKVLNLYVETGI